MVDLSEQQSSLATKITGADATGAETNYVGADSNGNLQTTVLDRSGTGTIGALNGAVQMAVNGCSSLHANVTGTWVATMVIEGLVNTTWVAIGGDVDATDFFLNSFSINTLITVNCGGFTFVRIRASAYTSGTATVDWNAGAGTALVEVFNGNGNQLKTRDCLDTAGQNRAQSVTTTAAEALGAGTILLNRKMLSITPTNGTIYWGFTNAVTTATGNPIFKNSTFTISATDNLHVYVISAGTVDTRIAEAS